MLRFVFSCFFGLLMVQNALSQEIIILKPAVCFNDSSTFFVLKVLDERSKQTIGSIDNRQLFLEPNVATAIQGFMDTCFPKNTELTPIVIKINAFEIQKEQTSFSEITARVHIDLTFFESNGIQLKELYRTKYNEDKTFDELSNDEIRRTHEKRIRAGLEYCMRSFIYHTKPDKINKNSILEFNINTDAKFPKWLNIVSVKKIYSSKIEGWNISYTGFADNDNDFIVPFVLSFDKSKLKSDILTKNNLKSVDTYSLSGGFDGFFKFSPGVYIGMGAQIPFGYEILHDLNNNRTSNLLIGIRMKEGIRIIPWQDSGIVMGINFFQKFQTSKTYHFNSGFEVELGINF